MNNVEYEKLVEQVLKASGALGSAKKNLRRELESHIWEAIRIFKEEGVTSDEIPKIIIQRFGSPEIIGQQLSLMHGIFKKTFFILTPLLLGVIAIALLNPGDGRDGIRRYQEYIQDTYLDLGWYSRAEYLAGRETRGACAHTSDGIGVSYIPAGHIITTCDSAWLVLKFLPPLKLTGPEVRPYDVLHVMKMEGGLRSVDAVDGEDDLEEVAQGVLEDYLRALAIGAWNAPIDGIVAMNFDESIQMGEAVDRQYALLEAATYWEGGLSQLAEWNPKINPTDEVALFRAACASQILCYPLQNATVRSVSRMDDQAIVIFDVQLQGESDAVNASHFEFQVTRFEEGYPNDSTDDVFRVTKGFAYSR
jgi:hypothetical protein